jgi:hypothetical protein
MDEFKVGRLVRILQLTDENSHGYGHKIGDVGVISGVIGPGILVTVPNRVSTNDFKPAVLYTNIEKLELL